MSQPLSASKSSLVPEVDPVANSVFSEVGAPPEEPTVSVEEADELRKEKLEAIRQLVLRGDYDSDELLAKAMDRMVQRMLDDPGDSGGFG